MTMPTSRFVFVLSVAFLLLGEPSAAQASYTKKSVPETSVSTEIKDGTVNLYCRLKAGKKILSSSGSGVFISERGVILTNAHVAQYFLVAGEKGRVTGWCAVRTGSPAKETYTAEVLYIPPAWLSENSTVIEKSRPKGTGENDFAFLYVTGVKKGSLPATFPALAFGTTPTEEQAITVAGYPTEKLDFDDTRNKLALVAATSTISNLLSFANRALVDAFAIAPSVAGAGGVSGGPVTDERNRLLGVVTSKGSTKDGNASLRAITAEYVDRQVQAQLGIPLAQLLTEDFTARAALTRAMLPENTITDLMNGLRKRK